MLTTGTFSDITSADDANPFTFEILWEVDSITITVDTISPDSIVYDTTSFVDTVLKRPNLPGEDFLDVDSLSAATGGVYTIPVNLLSSSSATVFVSIEPSNMVTDTTNFPLIMLGRRLPVGAEWNLDYVADGFWTLHNWAGYATGTNGFPLVTARIKRQ